MRLGVVWRPGSNAQYRAFQPMKAMARRGHRVAWPADENGDADLPRLVGCDLVHVFRRHDAGTRRVLAELIRAGTPITYDNDDDFTTVPPSFENFKGEGRQIFAATVRMAKAARRFSTTNEVLAERYRRAGVPRVDVIGNYLAPDALRRRRPHDGVVIGWIAAREHRLDAASLKLRSALQRVLREHDDARVECIGVNLRLSGRYSHTDYVDFDQLPDRIAGFDIGIAPLADIPFNRARSDIKLKEYAAAGIPWLASPVGPYAALGERQGGRLIPADGWFDALEAMVTRAGEREALGRAAEAWAREQTIDEVADRWERLFLEAVGHSAGTTVQLRPGLQVRMRKRPSRPGTDSATGR
jgi:glycosyltransferase involved in cell wall biosynthesis